MKILIILALAILAGLYGECAHAADYNFICSIQDAKKLGDDGVLAQSTDGRDLSAIKVDINRETGKIIGGIFQNFNDNSNIIVIDRGSDNHSFKVITVYSPFTSVDYAEVMDYYDAKIKPFIFYHNGELFTGICLRTK